MRDPSHNSTSGPRDGTPDAGKAIKPQTDRPTVIVVVLYNLIFCNLMSFSLF